MHVPTHALLGWLLAETARLERRDRALVFVAGVIPDLDGLTLLAGPEAFQTWHRILCHNALSALSYTALALVLARRKAVVGPLALLGFHLHLLCDLLGSAAPGGSNWGIPYLVPFVSEQLRFAGQWELASWQNVSVTIAALLLSAHLGARRGRTVVEVFSRRADAAVVEVLRRRWPLYAAADEDPPSSLASGSSSKTTT